MTFNRCKAMKKLFLTLGVAFLAFVACNKEIKEPTVVEDLSVIEAAPVVLTFTSEKPEVESETKTAWDSESSSIVWTTGDRIRVGYTLDGKWMSVDAPADFSAEPKVPAKFYTSNNVTINAQHANSGTFSVPTSYTNEPSGSAIFYGIYPSSCTSTDSNYAPSLTVAIPTTQTPGTNTFDKSADILVGKTAATELSGAFPAVPLALEWDRIVAHADITFKNLAIDGDTAVDKITLVFNSEAKVVGTIHLDVTDGAVTTTGSSTNQVEILGTNLSISAGTIEAWAAVLPVTFTSVDVTVKTDIATYTRSITGISKTFKKNARNTLGINMSSATRTLNTNLIADGNYVLAVKNDGVDYYAISSAVNAGSTRRDRVQITTPSFDPSDYSADSPYTAANAIIWTVTNVAGGVKINLAGDPAQYMKYGNNTLPLGSTGSTFEVANGSTTGTYTFTNNSRKISMNGTYGFGCYDPGSYITDLYVIPATGTPTITFTETSKNVIAEATSVSFTYSTVFVAGEPNVAVTSDAGSAVVSTSLADGTLTVNLNPNSTSSEKTVTLTVSATGASDVVLTINQAGAVPDATSGDTLWAEAFTGFSNNDVPAASNASTTVYGGGTITYSVGNGGGTTKIYGSDSTAGGTAPELLIAKGNGYLTASNIPTGNATGMTLTFKSNNDNVVVSSTKEGKTITYIGKSDKTYTYSVSVTAGTKSLDLTFTNNAGASTNIRIDDISLVAGAPVPGITVATNAATATSSATGTTATVNGTITLVNGAAIGDVTEAGFYYKLTSAGAFTKVTCASVDATAFSYDLTDLTKDAEYTFYSYAKYNGGSEVVGDPLTFTPRQAKPSYSVTYTVTSKTSVSISGTAPAGSSATYSQTHGTAKQATSGNSFTLTLSGYTGKKITAASVSMKSNTSGGAGSLSLKSGDNTIASIATAAFNTGAWHGSWSTSYVPVSLTVTETTVGTGENVVLSIEATANSLYFESLTLSYE